MADFPNSNIPSNPIAIQNNRIIKAGESVSAQKSSDYMVKQGAGGSVVKPYESGYTPAKYRDNYDVSASYNYHDIVSISSSIAYVDEFGTSYTTTQGTWICVQPVPPIRTATDRTNINASSLPANVKADWLRQSGFSYLPHSPEPTGTILYWKSLGGSGGGDPVWV